MLTPSTAHLWTNCALTAQLSRRGPAGALDGLPPPIDDDPNDTDARREGQAADWVANGVLRGDAVSAGEFFGETAPNGWIVTADMVQHVQGYVDYCQSLGEVVHTQVKVSIPHLSINGRLDSMVIANSSTLHIVELKYGWLPIEVTGNPQLICEALATFDPEKHDDVIMTIYQPRPHHPDGKIRDWRVDEPELTTWYNWLASKAFAALAGDPQGRVGPWCTQCGGRARCEALTTSIYTIFEGIRGGRMEAMSAAALGAEASFLEIAGALIKARKSGVAAEVEGRMLRGEFIPGWMFEQRTKDREFALPMDIVGMLTGVDPYKQVPKTPAEMEREGADVRITNDPMVVKRDPAGRKLVPATQSAIAKLFKAAMKSGS